MPSAPVPQNPVLIVDDEAHILRSLTLALNSGGIDNVITCQDSRKVEGILEEREIDVLILDLTMPYISGRELLPRVREEHPLLPVIVVTGVNEADVAVDCMKQGAFDYLVKAVEKNKLLATVRRAIEIMDLKRENSALKSHLVNGVLEHDDLFTGFIIRDRKMRSILMYLEAIAKGSQTVLITGETGVGKELVARSLHEMSGRQGQFAPVNIAGLDANMFADTLFGHVRGAYTGAEKARQGLIEKASGGTLFLDEIGDLDNQSQIRLLRLLEAREFYPLGSDVAKRSDARIVVATNKNLDQAVRESEFRKDLYFRLRTHMVRVPPLRERSADLPLLLDHFITEAAVEFDKQEPQVPEELYGLLKSYPFQGNVRELRAMAYDVVGQHVAGRLSTRAFKETMGQTEMPVPESEKEDLFSHLGFLPTIKEATQRLIEEALTRADGNQSVAARTLGISPQAMSKRLKQN